jgi:hypothetical protein
VLESRAAAEMKELPATLMTRVLTILGTIAQATILEDTDDDGRRDDASTALDDVLGTGDQAHAKSSKDGVDQSLAPEDATNTPRSASLRRIASMTRAASINDCPLTCFVSAIAASMPRRLSALRTSDAAVELTRVWTTMLCISVLERLNNSWIWGDGCVRDASRLCARAWRPPAHASSRLINSPARPQSNFSDLYPEHERTIVDGTPPTPAQCC